MVTVVAHSTVDDNASSTSTNAHVQGLRTPRAQLRQFFHLMNKRHLVWLPILGPAAFVFWRHLARQLAHHPDGVTTSLAALAVDLGLGSPHGSQSAVHRTVRRLERFGLLRWVGDDCLVLSARLPFVSPAQLARLAPSVQARHRALRDGASSQAR